MAVLDFILETRTPKGGGGRGGRGSSWRNNRNGSSRNGSSSRHGFGGGRRTGINAPTAAWFLALPIWARVLVVIGILWACIIFITFLRFLYLEYRNHKTKGERFSGLNVLKQTFMVACGGFIFVWIWKACAGLLRRGQTTKKKGASFYEKVHDEEATRPQYFWKYQPPAPTLAPSPPLSPVLKPAAAAR